MSPMPDSSLEVAAQLDRRLREALGDVGRAFFNFPSLTDVQRAAIPRIAKGCNTLVCAATAAGKTEAVMAPLLWRLGQGPAVSRSGPRLLAVAPTRALVADLVARLEAPLAQIGLRGAAQTSDFAGAESGCEVLITTPESFDSMLVRRIRRSQGTPVGHLLANVAAVFVDEAHCFDSSVRGEQLRFLLARLQKLRSAAVTKGWGSEASIQVCAASATVHEPEALARRLLGPGAEALVCPGSRPMDIWTTSEQWLRIGLPMSASWLAGQLPRTTGLEEVCELVWRALESGECRKGLIFVPSRCDCDLLGRELRKFLGAKRAISVDSHHGSLSRDHRQKAERDFHERRDAVLVATNTLEVGVDIGDVDVVALLGAPSDTSSLLQRIGRGGRRSGLTRLLPIARHTIDAAALGSEILCAVQGQLDARHRINRWDVLPQQVISYIRQNQDLGRSISAMLDLVTDVWPGPNVRALGEAHIQAWLDEGLLTASRGRIHLAGKWEGFTRQGEMDFAIHCNFRSASAALAIRDKATGEVIGHVKEPADDHATLTIGGRQHRMLERGEAIIVTPVDDQAVENREDAPKYGGRRRRLSEAFAAHVRAGCGVGESEAPIVTCQHGPIWFHFGGESFESALCSLLPHLLGKPVVAGIALPALGPLDSDDLDKIDPAALTRFAADQGLSLLEDEGLGRFADCLPPTGVEALTHELAICDRFTRWLRSRRITAASPEQLPRLEGLLPASSDKR